jgi:hypothetical protein
MNLDWTSLDNAACYVMKGDGFVVNDYGHPDYLRYIEGRRRLTLSYKFVDETTQRGRRYFLFRNVIIDVQVPTTLLWDEGDPLTPSEATTVLDRICTTMTQYKKRPCRIVIDDQVYNEIQAVRARLSRGKR